MTDSTETTGATEATETTEEQRPEAAPEAAPEKGQAKGAKPENLPPLDFTSFILSLSSSVLMHLGVVENPVTKKTEKELPVARQTIDLIELLKDKTDGNLTEEEGKLMDNVLHELRMLYIKASG